MFRKPCIAFLFSIGLTSAQHNWAAKQGTNSTAPKLKTVSFCLTNENYYKAYNIAQIDPNDGTSSTTLMNINTFAADAFSCADLLGGVENPTRLGEINWNCIWGGFANPPLASQKVECQGLISLTSDNKAKNKGDPVSSAFISFWANATELVEQIYGDEMVYPPSNPIVIRSTGSWPKPESVKSFTWATISSVPTFVIQVTIQYKNKGWNPISVLAGH